MTGIIILAHGSRQPDTKNTLDSIISKVKSKLNVENIEGAYLQLCEPSLEMVVQDFYKKGINNITIMPMFLFGGVHVQTDIPECIENLKDQMPGLQIELTGHIGDDDRIAQIVIDRIGGN